jgi:hypothetical protein
MTTLFHSQVGPSRPLYWRSAACLSALLLMSASGAAARTYNPSNLPQAQLTEVGDICKSVIRVSPHEERYSSCVESLSNSLAKLGRGAALEQARNTCIAKGLKANTPELAECVLSGSDSKADPPSPLRPVSELTVPGAAKPYSYTSNENIFRREQLSCAELGLDPTSGAFNTCVASLETALFEADNTAH